MDLKLLCVFQMLPDSGASMLAEDWIAWKMHL